MNRDQPSGTALATAAARAAHLIVDAEPWILEDSLALPLLGDEADRLINVHRDPGVADVAAVRVAITSRSRYVEGHLSKAASRGIRQVVILGAGLDSLAYRSPHRGRLSFFEVDHPVTQAWKRERLKAASIPVPGAVTFVAVDFRDESLDERLGHAGFDRSRPAFVIWLGVTQYLTPTAIGSTLDVVGRFAPASELVVEYLVPEMLRDDAGRAMADWFMPRAAASGEPWLTFFTPDELAENLRARGLVVTDDVARRDQVDHSIWRRSDRLRPHELGRLARAVLPPSRAPRDSR
jgi:methyltransferase (TIGR00027 family)